MTPNPNSTAIIDTEFGRDKCLAGAMMIGFFTYCAVGPLVAVSVNGFLHGVEPKSNGPNWFTVQWWLIGGIFGVTTYLLLAGATPPSSTPVVRSPWWSRAWRTVVVFIAVPAVLALGREALDRLDGGTTGSAAPELTGEALVAQTIERGLAGFIEEPAFVGIPLLAFVMVGARRMAAGRSAPAMRWLVGLIAFSALCRAGLHLYQGVGPAIGAASWGATTCVIFWRWRSLAALIVAHGIFNLVWAQGLPRLPHAMVWLLVCTAVVAVAAVIAVVRTPPATRRGAASAGARAAGLRRGDGA